MHAHKFYRKCNQQGTNLGPELHNDLTQLLALLLFFSPLVCLLAFLSQPCADSLVYLEFSNAGNQTHSNTAGVLP